MAYALDSGVRGALNDAYKRRLEAEAEAAGEPPRRPTPAFGIPNPTRGQAAAMPRRQSSSDETKTFDFGEPQTAVGGGGVEEQPPATQSFMQRTKGGGALPEAKRTLAYSDRAQLDQALAEAGVQVPGTQGAESDKAGLKRTMAYALPGDQLEAARQEAMAAARAEAEASAPRQQRGMTAPARNKPQLKSTMAFLPPATGSAGAAAGPAAAAGQPKSPQGVSLPSVTAKKPEQAAVNAGLSSTIAFSGGLAEEPTASRAPYVSRPAEEQVNLGATLVAGVGTAPARPHDSEVTRVSPGLADVPPAAPAVHVAVQEAAPEPAAPAHQSGGYPPVAAAPGAMRPGYPSAPQIAPGQPGAIGQGGYPPAPIAGSTAGPPTVALPDTAQGAFVRPPMQMSAPVGAPPPVPLVQAQPQVTSASNNTALLVAIVVGVVTVLALIGGAVFWLTLR